ncbi:Chromo domain protein [Aspergillus sclerotialis]|uniref:Chromo domain protein n=1 Tax=Aspergillus sclerotialis TaxID=2070753 RepID=A0A3A2ZEA2_9EURO|nr:Chromo domain protein [Aspergillus sclerotialis]
MDVEDDNISITSTAPSDFEAEYEVKTVLDERQTEYGMQYLVWWEGYPIERSTWEPKESFNNPQTLTDWEKKKHQIEAGERHPFDLPKFEQRLAKIERQRLERKRKRAEKRSRLGIEQPNTPQPDPLATSSAPSNPNERVTSQRRLSQENIPLTTRVKSTADKPRMVGFGKPNTSPAGPRSKATSAKESPVRFKLLSTQHKHNKAMARERAPDVNQLDLRRPSDWPSRNTNVTSLGHHFISPSHGGRSTQAPSESNDIRHDANTVRPDVAGRYSSQPAERTENEMPDHFPGLRQEDIEPRGLSIRGLADRALYDHNGKANPNSGYSHARESRAKGMPRLPSRRPRRGCHMTGESSGNRFWNLGEILIHMFYGPAKEEIGSARICGLPTTQKLTLLGSKKQTRFDLWFQHSCTYEEYRMLCNKASDNIKFGNGWIEGFDDTEPKIYNLGEELKTKGLMAICYPDGDESKLVLLAYSPDSSIFDFLGESRSTEPSFLTVAVRSPFTPVGQPKYHPTQQLSPPPAMSSPPAPPSAPSQSGGEKSIDADDYFKEKFGVTFADLATVQSNQGKRVANVFYLMFPLDNTVVQQECELFIAFLRNRGREPVIFSNRDPDDWQKFIGSSSEGVVIFHQSFVHHNTLRDLSKKALCHRSFNFWNVSIVRPLDHVDRPLHLQRIFPFGGAILLTEDFMISDPKGAAVILTWFNEWIRKQYKGTWKIMLRPDALNWLVKQHDLETVKEKAG